MKFLLLLSLGIICLIPVSCTQIYDPEIAKESWIMCLASYCPQRAIESWSAAQMSKLYPNVTGIRVTYDEPENTLAYLAYNNLENIIYVVFRGTEPWSITNWINNLDVLKKKYPFCQGCEVHSGFYDTYLRIEPEIFKNLEEMKSHYPGARIRVTGHSLGAAFALLAALEIERTFGQLDEFYSFGLPRVGNEEFSSFYNEVFKGRLMPRITNGRDPVPHMPMEQLGFVHPNTEVFYTDSEKGDYRICPEVEDESCSNSFILPLDVNSHFDYMGYNYLKYVIKDCILE